jgi:hypothetical protein
MHPEEHARVGLGLQVEPRDHLAPAQQLAPQTWNPL